MKKLALKGFLFLLFCSSSVVFAQFNFSVNPGLNYNGANVGYKLGNFLPYAGVNYYGGKATYYYSGTEFDYTFNQMMDFEEEYEFSAKVILPTIGTKYYFVDSDVKAYASANITIPILNAKVKENGVNNPDVQDYLDKFSLTMGEVGFGAEYFFSPHFSLSGEFGVRWFRTKFSDTYDAEVYNDNTFEFETHEFKQEVTGFISPTYTKVGLNFYFGSGGIAKE